MRNYLKESWHNEDGWNEEQARKYHETGDIKIRNRIIERNQRLVAKIAHKYAHLTKSIEEEELLDEGNLGFIHAIEKFDYNKGRLMSYATWWIKQSIHNAIAKQDRLVHLPYRKAKLVYRLKKAREAYAKIYHAEPAEEWLANYLKTSVKEIHAAAKMKDTLSLDSPLEGKRSTTLGTILADAGQDSPTEEVENKMLIDLLHNSKKVSDRNRDIIEYRYGINGKKRKTLRELEEELGINRETIRKIEKKTLGIWKNILEEES